MLSDVATLMAYLVVLGVSEILTVYAAYLALTVWKGLAVPIYRSRALWTGVLAILFANTAIFSSIVYIVFPQQFTLAASIAVNFVLYTLVLVAIYVWIDRTISTLVRLDFLRRDLVGWKRLRPFYWAFAIGSIVLSTFPSPPSASLLYQAAVYTSLLVPFTYGAVALIVGSAKTRDMTFRSHARWGGFLMLAITIATLTYFLTANVVAQNLPFVLISYSPFVLVSYCFYKMAKHLVPTGTLSPS